jgi:hypothetical protein
VEDEVARIAAIRDRSERLRTATERLATTQRTMTELARLRRGLIQELHDDGWSYARIADAAGLSRGRIHQVRHQGPAPEGAFFGTHPLHIVTPLKVEQRGARPVVAVEDVTASQRLADFARTLGFESEFEQIPLSGEIDLNRDGLIVISGPRISDAIADVLSTDPALEFTKVNDVWALADRRAGTVMTSGSDATPPRPYDVAYLGRLGRPDHHGTVTILTGIHPPGSLGVIHHLVNDLASLHREAGVGRFSVLLGVDYDPTTHEPQRVRRISPVYRHDEEPS